MSVSTLPSARKTELDVAENFILAFDLPKRDDEPVPMTVDAFDKWATRCGYYDNVPPGNYEALVTARQRVRQALNNVALGEPWRAAGNTSFAVQVYVSGETYHIVSAAQGYVQSGVTLPQRVQGIADTRFRQLTALKNAVDYGSLPDELRIEIRQQLRAVEHWKERLALETQQLEEGFRQLRDDVRKISADVAALIENHDT